LPRRLALRTKRRHDAAGNEVEILCIQQDRELPKLDSQQHPDKGCLSTHWRAGPLKAFYDKTQAKFPKRWAKNAKNRTCDAGKKLFGTKQGATATQQG